MFCFGGIQELIEFKIDFWIYFHVLNLMLEKNLKLIIS